MLKMNLHALNHLLKKAIEKKPCEIDVEARPNGRYAADYDTFSITYDNKKSTMKVEFFQNNISICEIESENIYSGDTLHVTGMEGKVEFTLTDPA